MLATLRETVARLERASLEGDDVALLFARQRRIEAAIRQRSQRAEGDFAEVPRFPSPANCERRSVSESLSNTSSTTVGCMLLPGPGAGSNYGVLGSAHQVAAERFMLQFALRRLALRRSSHQVSRRRRHSFSDLVTAWRAS